MTSPSEMPQMNRDYARLLLVMRKLIRAEFDVNIAIDQPETTTLLIHYARRSNDSLMHEMANELEELLAPSTTTDASKAKAPEAVPDEAHHDLLRYRGAVIDQAVADHEEMGKKVKRVYRGRVIEE